MPWWGWMSVGIALLAAEMALVDAEFYLVFLGLAAVLVGLAELAGLGGPAWMEWLAFAVGSVLAMVAFRGRVYESLRGGGADPGDGLVGETAVVQEPIGPGASGRAQLRGSVWTVRNEGDQSLEAGARVRVEAAEGLVLRVRPTD